MLWHRLFGRILCRQVATWVSGGCFAAVSSSLLSPGFFGDGVSLLQVQFVGNLVRVSGLGVSVLLIFLLLWLRLLSLPVVCWLYLALVFSLSLVLCVLVLAKLYLATSRFVYKLLS